MDWRNWGCGSYSASKTGCLSSADLVLKAWEIHGESLVFCLHWNVEEAGDGCSQGMAIAAAVFPPLPPTLTISAPTSCDWHWPAGKEDRQSSNTAFFLDIFISRLLLIGAAHSGAECMRTYVYACVCVHDPPLILQEIPQSYRGTHCLVGFRPHQIDNQD